MSILKPTLNTYETGVYFKIDDTYDRERYYRDYRLTNRDKILERGRDYYEKNSEKILKRSASRVTCECGREVSYANVAVDKKSKIHTELLEQIKE